MKSVNRNTIMWGLVVALMIMFLDLTLFNPGLIFLLIIASSFIYFGKKRLRKLFGKLFFGLGLLLLFIAIVNTLTFKLLLLAVLTYAIYQLFESSKKNKNKLSDESSTIKIDLTDEYKGKILKKTPFLQNVLWGSKQTTATVYDWQDINIQTGIGDCVIDLSNTVLPEGTSVISIRSLAGNIKILVPYEQEVSIHHSVLSGSLNFFGDTVDNLINKSLYMQTENFDMTSNKVKIITSSLVGKIEVKRI